MFGRCERLFLSYSKHLYKKKSFMMNEPIRGLHFTHELRARIMGIETSCDDTGCAIIDETGKILGESLRSQHLVHLRYGGIIPPIARDLHRVHIEPVVDETLKNAGIDIKEIDALAVTVKPGLSLSLSIGMKFGKYLCRKYDKPFIPIHHMKAHSLIVRMNQKVEFPFLVLLISGGHCLLSLAKNIDEFLLLGEGIDDAPGEAFDKVSRRMKLSNIPELSQLSGGQAIEKAAAKAENFGTFVFPKPLSKYRDCNFSFSGIKYTAEVHLTDKERLHELGPDSIIPEINDLCADFQMAITEHLCRKTQRAMEFIERKNLIPNEHKTFVVSGGVACNQFIIKSLQTVCAEMGYAIFHPEKKLCTDNGIMIAWNGMEKWLAGTDIVSDLSAVDIEPRCPLGVSIGRDVIGEQIKCAWIKLPKAYAEGG